MFDVKYDIMGKLLETPDRAVVDGQVQFGRFARPFRELNLLDAQCGIPESADCGVSESRSGCTSR